MSGFLSWTQRILRFQVWGLSGNLVKEEGTPELILDYGAQTVIRSRCVGTVRARTQCKSNQYHQHKPKYDVSHSFNFNHATLSWTFVMTYPNAMMEIKWDKSSYFKSFVYPACTNLLKTYNSPSHLARQPPSRPCPPHSRGFLWFLGHTQRRTTVGRTPLEE